MTDIRKLTEQELEAYAKGFEEKAFRGRQIYEWLWKKAAVSFEEMTNLSKELRKNLNDFYKIFPAGIEKVNQSVDGTCKVLFKLHDNQYIEGVVIPTPERVTACISSQVGCTFKCRFCATGTLNFERNLDAGEIFDQYILLNKLSLERYNKPLSNIVYMGMGEPLMNYKNVVDSVDKLTTPKGQGISSQRITVSTVGLPKMIKKLGDDGFKANLALSLHAASNDKREKIIPLNKKHPIEELIKSLEWFNAKTKTKITLEYLMLGGFNDSIDDAKQLASICKSIPCKVNLIEYNPVAKNDFKASEQKSVESFKRFLENKDIIVNVRKSRGNDINAACGQLASSNG